jgi:hypothetical protein
MRSRSICTKLGVVDANYVYNNRQQDTWSLYVSAALETVRTRFQFKRFGSPIEKLSWRLVGAAFARATSLS